MNRNDLTQILTNHKEWLESNGEKGARANLADADLAGANLADANLAGANLAGAYLAGADLAGADLASAYLARANLADADLAGANLADAYLAGANLADANLADADLAGANLAGANLADADLDTERSKEPREPYDRNKPIDYAARAARYRERHPDVPIVDNLDAAILRAIEAGGRLVMRDWHTCETTHCRGGWAITLAGEAGKKLEGEYGVQRAAAMIYKASTGRIPHFFASDEAALADIRKSAEEQP